MSIEDLESLEDRYAWPRFKEWLDKGNWKYNRFRYPEQMTKINIDALPLPDQVKINLKEALASINFEHDGNMSRGPESWYFDLKYESRKYNMVNVKNYDAYYGLSLVMPYLIAFYRANEDQLYFHAVRAPEAEPKFKKDYRGRPGAKNWVYIIPDSEVIRVPDDIPWTNPDSLVDYCAQVKAIESGEPSKPEKYKDQVIDEMKHRLKVKLWDVPKAQAVSASTYLETQIRDRLSKITEWSKRWREGAVGE